MKIEDGRTPSEPIPVSERMDFFELEASSRAASQLRFLLEIDALKAILRQTLIHDGSRRENSAEHSWHLALAAILLAEQAVEPVDVGRVVRMALVHDLVEIDAGDTFCYDVEANVDKAEREIRAADRIFGLLPPDQAEEWRALWEEFERGESTDARFAHAMDRLQPLLLNLAAEGGTWRIHGISRDQVLRRMAPVREAAPGLWGFVEAAIGRGVAAGWIRE